MTAASARRIIEQSDRCAAWLWEEKHGCLPVLTAVVSGPIYSLIVTAKNEPHNPQAWLADVLARIADHPAGMTDDFLSWNWKAQGRQLLLRPRKQFPKQLL